MIGNIRSYCSRNNKTIRLASRNRHRFNILDYSDDYYFYSKLSRSARNKYYSSLSSRATERDNQHNFHCVCIKCMLTHRLMGLRERV